MKRLHFLSLFSIAFRTTPQAVLKAYPMRLSRTNPNASPKNMFLASLSVELIMFISLPRKSS